MEMIVSAIATIVLVLLSILLMYETMRLTSDHLSEFPLPPRPRIMVVVLAVFIGHTGTIFLYAAGYWLLSGPLGFGGFGGLPMRDFSDFLYFSAVAYTSLGFGEVYPTGGIRMMSGFEALNGLLLIGWSATFTYLKMLKLWSMHRPKPRKAGRARRRRER